MFQGRNEMQLMKYLEESLAYSKHLVVGSYSYFGLVIIEDSFHVPQPQFSLSQNKI